MKPCLKKCEVGYDGAKNENGEALGYGVEMYEHGGVYEGYFIDGIRHGKGKLSHAYGDVFEGDWKDGYRHGKGIYTHADGNVYDENWKDGVRHGKGKYSMAVLLRAISKTAAFMERESLLW